MSKLGLPRDRRHDRMPIVPGGARGDMVLGRDVPGGVQVGMKLEAARSTLEPATRAAVITRDVSTRRTHLRGIPRVNPGHRHAPLFGLVLDKGSDLVERPAVNAPGLLAVAHRDPLADVGQVLQDNRPARGRRLHDALREDVITVAPKASLRAPGQLEPAQSRLGALRLQGATLLESARFEVPPRLLPEEPSIAGHG